MNFFHFFQTQIFYDTKMRSIQKIWCRHFGIDIHNRPQEKMIWGKWYQKKNCAKNSDTKNDTEKVVQKYAATKKYVEKPRMGKDMWKIMRKMLSLCGQSDADQALAQNTRRLQFILQNSHPKKRWLVFPVPERSKIF